MAEDSQKGSLIDKVIDFAFSDDSRKWLLLLLVVGFFLRFIVANHVNLIADEMLHGTHAINILHSGVINLQNQAPAWFYLTDMAYSIFGVKAFAGRFLSILFGAFTILLVYALGKEMFDEKIGLIAATLLTFSAYTIRYSLMEMDIAMMFFVLLAFYYFQKDIKAGRISYYAPIFMGVAVLLKAIALPFIPAFLIYFFFFVKKDERKEIWRKNKKKLIASLAILAFFAMPIIAYNIILYQQKGITDVLFSRFLGISPGIYQGLQGFERTFSIGYLFSDGIRFTVQYAFWDLDPAIFILSILGFALIFTKEEYKAGRFFAAFHVLTLIFLMGTSLLQTHFVSFMPLLCISAAIFIKDASEKFGKESIKPKQLTGVLMAGVIIVNLFLIFPHLTSQSAIFQMRDYASANFGSNDIVVADGRIYRGRIAWMFNDKMYVEAPIFAQVLAIQDNMSGQTSLVNVYFVECVMDDCGWGTIKDQPEFNASMEQMVQVFEKAAIDKKIIYGGGGFEDEKGKPYFNVYKTVIPLKSQSFALIKNTHDWFYYPVRWEKNDWYDKYYPETLFQSLLQLIGKIALWIAIITAILAPILLLYEILKK